MISWERDLEGATTPLEIVQLTRGFIASMPQEDFAMLPDDCRPSFISSTDDVRAWSKRLNEAYWAMRAGPGDPTVIQDIWSFFLRATVQLARIEEEGTVS